MLFSRKGEASLAIGGDMRDIGTREKGKGAPIFLAPIVTQKTWLRWYRSMRAPGLKEY